MTRRLRGLLPLPKFAPRRRVIHLALGVATLIGANGGPASACSFGVRRPGFRPEMSVWLTATPESVYVGAWRDYPPYANWKPATIIDALGNDRTSRMGPLDSATEASRLFGQLVRVERVDANDGGELQRALDRSGGRALFIPYVHRADCMPMPAGRATWLPPVSMLTTRPRPASMWVNGLPTFDVHVGLNQDPPGDNPALTVGYTTPILSVADYWSLRVLLPRVDATPQEREAALKNVRSWMGTHRALANLYPANVTLRDLGIWP